MQSLFINLFFRTPALVDLYYANNRMKKDISEEEKQDFQ